MVCDEPPGLPIKHIGAAIFLACCRGSFGVIFFDFVPKMIMITPQNSIVADLLWIGQPGVSSPPYSESKYTLAGTTFSWYVKINVVDSSEEQLNKTGITYLYWAIG